MLGRPEKSEAAHYYFPYIDQVEGNDPQAAFVSQMDDALALFATISKSAQHIAMLLRNGVFARY